MQDWHSLVSEYSKASPTNRSDRLVAIGGLAKALCTLEERHEDRPSSDTYLCGLWRQTFAQDLLWYISDSDSILIPRLRMQ